MQAHAAKRIAVGLGVTLVASLAGAWAQTAPRIGYVYPAGGQRGTVVHVAVGGQGLGDPEHVYVSGEGVSASVVEYIRALDGNEEGRTWGFMREMVRRRWNAGMVAAARTQAQDMPPLPDHPWLRDLDDQNPLELAHLRARLFDPKRQPNAQISEQVAVEVRIAADAAPGDRELRLLTAGGLSNPVRFQVGTLAEAREEDLSRPGDLAPPPVELPVMLNGQVRPGGVDHFRLRARQGQRLVIRVQARRLIPYLADAVPGWFQATVALTDPQGNEVASADDFRFDPDPVLAYGVPADGVYGLAIRDAIYRGRDDFVYRIAVGELPLVTSVFPLGGQEGAATTATLAGWNLPGETAQLDTAPGGLAVRRLSVGPDPTLCGDITYAVEALPECLEAEPNDSSATAQEVAFPQVINGRIQQPGDVDVFCFSGRAGDEVVAEVVARRLGSPVDAALQLLDPAGAVLAENDDTVDREAGLITHHADPYLQAKLPVDGTYQARLVDVQGQGGEEFAYRLKLRPAQPDFALRATPCSLSMPGRRPATITFHALRKDGFAGDIDVTLLDAPAGVTLSEARIPAGKDKVEATLVATREVGPGLYPLRLEGRAAVGGADVTRPVVPAEDMMQAFAYWHLVPQQELLAAVTAPRRVPAVWRPLLPGAQATTTEPVRISLGGTVEVEVAAPQTIPGSTPVPLHEVRFALSDPPRGLRLVAATVTPAGVTLVLKADANSTRLGLAANLIVEATVAADAAAFGARRSLGVLPAIPIKVVREPLDQ